MNATKFENLKKYFLVIQNKQVMLNVGAASSREIKCRGWKPLPRISL
jgi:hypothetical protein